MSVNLMLMFDSEFEEGMPQSDIHLCLRYVDELDKYARLQRVKTLTDLGAGTDMDALDEAQDEEEAMRMLKTFSPKLGRATFTALLKGLTTKALVLSDASEEEVEILCAELQELSACLDKAAAAKLKFRLVQV